jgi:hypothetical protein
MADDRAEDARGPDEEAHARALAAERIVTALLVRLVRRGTLAGADAAAVLADASDGLTSDAMSGRVPKRSATLATDRVRMLEALLGPADAATPGPITGSVADRTSLDPAKLDRDRNEPGGWED